MGAQDPLDTEVRYVDADGEMVTTSLRQLDLGRASTALPVRRLWSHARQRRYSGRFWSATTRGHVPYESRLELDRLRLADFDPGVRWKLQPGLGKLLLGGGSAPPPVHVPSSAEFRAANARLQEISRARGPDTALDEFLTLLIGPDWRNEVEQRLPGAAEQMQRDTTTFFDTDMPALLSWRFDAEDARRITCPVLQISGSDSGSWFAEVRALVLAWLPQTEDVLLTGADHSLALTHTAQVADALAAFLGRHATLTGGGLG